MTRLNALHNFATVKSGFLLGLFFLFLSSSPIVLYTGVHHGRRVRCSRIWLAGEGSLSAFCRRLTLACSSSLQQEQEAFQGWQEGPEEEDVRCISDFASFNVCSGSPFIVIACSTDPFARKEWYNIKAPAVFRQRNVGKTPVNKTAGTSTLSLSHSICEEPASHFSSSFIQSCRRTLFLAALSRSRSLTLTRMRTKPSVTSS
jgi:hypothetical protein